MHNGTGTITGVIRYVRTTQSATAAICDKWGSSMEAHVLPKHPNEKTCSGTSYKYKIILDKAIIYIHPYIIGHCNPSVRIKSIDLVSHTT